MTNSTCREIIINSINLSLSASKADRARGTEGLESLAQSLDQFLVELLTIFNDSNLAFPIRLFGATVMKNTFGHVDYINDVSPETRTQLRKWLVASLSLPERGIRNVVGYIVARIAQIEWPEEWPGFYDDIMEVLTSIDLNCLDGAMAVLSDLVRDDLSDLAFPEIAPRLMPELNRLYQDNSTPLFIKAQTMSILREFVETIYMVKEEHPEVVPNYLNPLLEMWRFDLEQSLKLPISSETLPLKNEALRTIVGITRAFPQQTNPLVLGFMGSIWTELAGLVSVYQGQYVNGEVEHEDESEDGMSSLVYSSLDFLQLVARKKAVKHILLSQLDQLATILLSYLQITHQMEESWTKDMNQFIQDDDEDAVAHSVRIAVDQCLENLVDAFGRDMIAALLSACAEYFSIGSEQRAGGLEGWWKKHEAALFLLGRFSSLVKENAQTEFLDHLFTDIVVTDMKCFAFPFLQGRTLWFASQFACFLPPLIAKEYMTASVEALSSPAIPLPVCVFAMKSVRSFLLLEELQFPLQEYQESIIKSLCAIARNAQEDSLILLLEVLGMAVKIDKRVTSNLESELGPILVHIWRENGEDVFIMEFLQDLFTELAANHFMANAFQTRMFPLLIEALAIDNDVKFIAFTALDLFSALIQKVPDPLPPVYTQQVYPRVIQMMLNVEDSGLLQNGQELLKHLVNRDFEGIARSNGPQGLDFLLEFISKMLSEEQSQSAAIFVGPLLTKFIQKGGELIVPFIPQLLTAVLRRLETAQMPAFVETLVIVFCHMIEKQCATVLSFLSSTTLQNSNSGLQVFFSAWCDTFGDFQGAYQVKLSTATLMMVLGTGDPILNDIIVKGDLIVPAGNKKIVTRSMSQKNPDQFKMIPFPVRGLELIIDEYESQLTSKMKSEKAGMAETEELYETDSEGDPDPYSYFGEYEHEESVDSDILEDPIYNLDLVVAIKDWLNGMNQSHPIPLQALRKQISSSRCKCLDEIVS